MNKREVLKITCPTEPDMNGTFDKAEIEEEMRELMQNPQGNDWIEWVMYHCDVDDYFSSKIVEIVSMPEFKSGTFEIKGIEVTFTRT